jgi:hypothetical protein
MRATALSTFLLLGGCAAHGSMVESSSKANDESSREIFSVVLQGWLDRNERGNAIYVSKSTYPLPDAELQKFSTCAKSLEANTLDLFFDPISKVVGSIANPRLHFTNHRFWLTPDPKRISSIIEEGRPAGLISLSSVAFDRERTIAVLHFSMTCGPLCGYGETLVFDKTASGWIQRPISCDGWMS